MSPPHATRQAHALVLCSGLSSWPSGCDAAQLARMRMGGPRLVARVVTVLPPCFPRCFHRALKASPVVSMPSAPNPIRHRRTQRGRPGDWDSLRRGLQQPPGLTQFYNYALMALYVKDASRVVAVGGSLNNPQALARANNESNPFNSSGFYLFTLFNRVFVHCSSAFVRYWTVPYSRTTVLPYSRTTPALPYGSCSPHALTDAHPRCTGIERSLVYGAAVQHLVYHLSVQNCPCEQPPKVASAACGTERDCSRSQRLAQPVEKPIAKPVAKPVEKPIESLRRPARLRRRPP